MPPPSSLARPVATPTTRSRSALPPTGRLEYLLTDDKTSSLSSKDEVISKLYVVHVLNKSWQWSVPDCREVNVSVIMTEPRGFDLCAQDGLSD